MAEGALVAPGLSGSSSSDCPGSVTCPWIPLLQELYPDVVLLPSVSVTVGPGLETSFAYGLSEVSLGLGFLC